MSEIAEYVWAEIRDAGYAKQLAAGIVLTGGGAALDHLADLFQKITSQQVRVSCAEVSIATESFEQVASPNLTMAVSLLLRGAKSGACPVRELQTVGPVKGVASPAKSEQKYVTPEPPVAEPKAEVVTPPVVNEPVVKDTDNWGNEVDDGGDIDEDDEPQSNKNGLLGWFIRQINGAFKPVDDIDDEEEDY
jgi:cell division ATPase FtsA